VAGRRHPEHPRLRGRLPRRARATAGGELPLATGHPRRRFRARRPQREAQGQDVARGEDGRGPRASASGGGRVPGGGVGRLPHLRPAGRGPGGGALPHELPEPAVRGGPHAGGRALRGVGGRRLLRAPGGEGRPRLPAAHREPPRSHGPAPGGERAAERDRGPHGAGAGAGGEGARDLDLGSRRGPPSLFAASGRWWKRSARRRRASG